MQIRMSFIAYCLITLLGAAGCDVIGGKAESQMVPEEPDREEVQKLSKKVTEYEVEHNRPIAEQGSSWQLCTFYIGTLATYGATGEARYRKLAFTWAQANDWQFRRLRHADSQCIGQVYLELYLKEREPHMLHASQEIFDAIMDDPKPGHVAWSWADALFMAPPVLARLTEATGNTAYVDFMSRQFWEASAPLFDPQHNLYYRDQRYVNRDTEHGQDVFWSRGNGWVLAGLARILQFLPSDHPSHPAFVARFRTMASSIAQLQQKDGLWRTSLLDPEEYPAPESSGTALFCYALAWGINAGYLDENQYLPVVLRAWAGLKNAVNDQGRLGWVQAPGSRPGPVSRDDTGAYGTGAFLMAGSELLRVLDRD